MIIQMQLVAQMCNSLPCFAYCNFAWFGANANMKFTVAGGTTFRIGRNKLSHSRTSSMRSLFKLYFGHNNIVFNHRTAICAYRISPTAIHFNIGRSTILTFQSTCHLLVVFRRCCFNWKSLTSVNRIHLIGFPFMNLENKLTNVSIHTCGFWFIVCVSVSDSFSNENKIQNTFTLTRLHSAVFLFENCVFHIFYALKCNQWEYSDSSTTDNKMKTLQNKMNFALNMWFAWRAHDLVLFIAFHLTWVLFRKQFKSMI